MNLARRLTGNPDLNRPRCILGYYLDEHDDPATRQALADAVEYRTKRKWTAEALAAELAGERMPVSASTIRTHRRGACVCAREGQT